MPQKSLVEKGLDQRRGANSRLAAVRRVCLQKSLTWILVTDPIDVAYISGFISSNAALLIGRRKSLLFTDFRYHTEALNFCKKHPQWTYRSVPLSLIDSAAKFIMPGDIVGFQSDRMSVDELKKLRKSAPGARFTGCGSEINDLLMARLPHEISAMEKAARAADAAFNRILGNIKPGVTELELVYMIENYCRECGSEKPAFDTIVLFGDRTALPHGRPGKRKLRRGEFVLMDFGCMVGGFASDMTRTIVLGKATQRQRKVYAIVQQAQQYARQHAKAGMSACAIDALGRTPIAKAGYGKQFGHALGHGVGRRIHEVPRISSQVSQKIPPGTVITIEPGIYIPGFGGVRIEDMVVLKEEGVRLLTHSPRELIEV